MSSTVRRLAIVAATTLALGLALAGTATARTLVTDRYEWSDAGTWSDCGPAYEYEAHGRGLFTLKQGRAGDPTPYLTDNYEWHWLNRNPANGKWFREDGQGLYKDLRITHLDGTMYRFIAQESGSPYTITTSDGEKIVMDRGLLRFQFDVDTKGDADLENDVHFDDSFQLLDDHGLHPLWHMTWDDYCGLVNELLS
jgi:hypothetical protein